VQLSLTDLANKLQKINALIADSQLDEAYGEFQTRIMNIETIAMQSLNG
jgi:hypothetical protein